MHRTTYTVKGNNKLNNSSCLICAGQTLEPMLLGCADLYLRTSHVVDYGVCKNCGLVQQMPIPVSTSDFYPISYPMHHSRGWLFMFARKFLIRGVYFDPKPCDRTKTLLDFGCGDGSYLESILGRVGRRIGFEAEPNQARQVGAQLGIDVISNQLDTQIVPNASVDIVTAHFVLEHLIDLDGAFEYWRRILKPNGRLHLAVPNINSFEARLFAKKWHGLDSPRHISFPNGTNMSRLAEKHGFRIVRDSYGIFPNTWAASFATVISGHFNKNIFLLMMPIGFLLACLMPQSTAIYELVNTD
jgi:SAM-dependent methyltransferase